MRRSAVAVVAIVAIGIGAGSVRAAPSAPTVDSANHVDHDTAAQRHAETVAFAKHVLSETPMVDGEIRLASHPKKLDHANSFPGASNRLERARYWKLHESAHRAYLNLKATDTPGLRLSGWGDVDAGGGHHGAQLAYDSLDLTPQMDYADEFIEIKRDGRGRSIIAAFAQVVPHPVRTKAEYIPAAASHTKLTRAKYSRHDKKLASRSRHLSKDQSTALVRSFNDLWVQPPWLCTGGPVSLGPHIVLTANITSGAHTWKLTYPEPCNVIDVERDGHSQAQIDPDKEFRQLLHADAPPLRR